MKNDQQKVLIGQGIGAQQPWSFDLQKKLQTQGISVWNEALPDAQIPLENTPKEWSEIFRTLLSPQTTAILHSASVISFLDALLRSKQSIQNLVLLSAWLKDPMQLEGREGKMVEVVFKKKYQGRYVLQPFLDLIESYRNKINTIKNQIQGEIIICHSLTDPYVSQEQADYAQNELGGKLITIPDGGHFQYREKKNPPENNAILPKAISNKIFEILKISN